MSITLRKGEKSDCPAVLKLIQELADFEEASSEMELTVEELQEDGFGENPIYHLLVAEVDGKIVGMALFYEKYSTWKGRSAYLEDLIVTEKYRGKGIGKLLFEAVVKESKKRNAGRMEWQVLDWNKDAIGFYEKYGAEMDAQWINVKFRKEFLQKTEDEGV